MRMYHEEIFGPVAQLFRVRDADEAIALANATVFGLGSNIWSRDADEQARFVRGLDAGAVFVNGMTTSYPGAAVRRREGVRIRPGAVGAGNPRVLQREDRLGRLIRE